MPTLFEKKKNQKKKISLLYFVSQTEYSIKRPRSDSRKSLVSVSDHGESLSTSCLSVGKDANIVAIHG